MYSDWLKQIVQVVTNIPINVFWLVGCSLTPGRHNLGSFLAANSSQNFFLIARRIIFFVTFATKVSYVTFCDKMRQFLIQEMEGGNKEKMRKWREWISLHFLIFLLSTLASKSGPRLFWLYPNGLFTFGPYIDIWTTPNWTTRSFGLSKFGLHPKWTTLSFRLHPFSDYSASCMVWQDSVE